MMLTDVLLCGVPDEAGDVDVDKGGHEVLAVESVHDATVTRDGVGKILKGGEGKKGTGGGKAVKCFKEMHQTYECDTIQHRCSLSLP